MRASHGRAPPEPIVFPLHLNADRTKMEGSGQVPGRPTSIDVVSVDEPGPVAHPSECYAIEEDQEHALDGASARIRECRLSENAVDEYSWTPPETPHSFPWLMRAGRSLPKAFNYETNQTRGGCWPLGVSGDSGGIASVYS